MSNANLTAAADHARAGRYDEARLALDASGGKDSTDIAVLDLLARIHAQQGDLVAADECWARVERLDGAHAGAREGRRRIHRIWSGRPRQARGVGIAVAAVVIVGAGTAGWGLTRQPPVETDQGVLDAIDRLGQDVTSLEAEETPAASAPPEQPVETLAAALEGAQWNTDADAQAVTVTFDDPLFIEGGATLSAEGETTLEAIAEVAGDLDVSITVIGHTDNVPVGSEGRYEDNVELGLARALAAAEEVATEGGIPLSDIAVASSGDVNPPHPNTTEEGRAKNRTVTLQFLPE